MDSSPFERKSEKKAIQKPDFVSKITLLLNRYKYILLFVILAIGLFVYKTNYKQEIITEPFSGTE